MAETIGPSPEVTDTPEAIQAPLFDAVLVHGYWLSQEGEGRVTRSLRSHVQDRAAAVFYHSGFGTKKLVLTAGHIWGPDYPSVAEVQKEELVRKYGVPEDDIVVKTTLVRDGEVQEVQTTDDEVEAFVQYANENELPILADIAPRVHNSSILPGVGANIPDLYKKRKESVVTFPAEGIILNSDEDPRIKAKIRGLGRSRFEWSFRLYEGVKKLILKLKPDYGVLSKRADAERSKKGDLGLPFIASRFPIDKYSL